MKKKLLSLALTLALTLTFTACNGGNGNGEATTAEETTTAETTAEVTTEETTEATTEPEATLPDVTVNVAVLSGPTGIGAVKLMQDAANGSAALNYNFTVETDNSNIVAAVSNGEVDIAAVATNVASNLYNKTSGGVKIAAVTAYGVLYFLENGDTINSISDLKGKTIYTTGQGANPEYILNYLLEQNGLKPGEDVTIEFMTAEEVTAKMVSGEAGVCMLPVPAVTAILKKSETARLALSVTDEWNKLDNGSTLTMSACIVRTEFAEQYPEVVNQFLKEYEASINYVKDNPEDISEAVASYGITPNAAIAAAAIPDCNLTFISGADEIKNVISGYFDVLFNADPKAIGGKMPGDDFYFE